MEKAKSKKMNYDFAYFLIISKTYKLGRVPKKGKKKNRPGQEDSLTFVNAEEELFFKVSHTIFLAVMCMSQCRLLQIIDSLTV